MAEDAETALRQARELRPQAILSDLTLDGPMDGLGLARAVRDDPSLPRPRLIALTGYSDDQHRQLVRGWL